MTSRSASQKTIINRTNAHSLLFPMAAFLNGGGLNKKDAISVFADAYDQAIKTLRAKKAEHIGNPLQYADVVSLWTHDKNFLDKSGRPRPLSMGGKNGFSMLVRQAQHKVSPKAVLSVLIRYGNVCHIKGGRYSLVKPYFNTAGLKNIAFEPHAYFLSDASVTLERMLIGTKGSQDPAPFWRKVENVNLSKATVKKFFDFSRRRSLAFLEEIDDWLEAHANTEASSKKRQSYRAGLGIFSVYSNHSM